MHTKKEKTQLTGTSANMWSLTVVRLASTFSVTLEARLSAEVQESKHVGGLRIWHQTVIYNSRKMKCRKIYQDCKGILVVSLKLEVMNLKFNYLHVYEFLYPCSVVEAQIKIDGILDVTKGEILYNKYRAIPET